jgi:hypothetical protein
MEESIKDRDSEMARKISDTLIGLNGFIHTSSPLKDFVNIANII